MSYYVDYISLICRYLDLMSAQKSSQELTMQRVPVDLLFSRMLIASHTTSYYWVIREVYLSMGVGVFCSDMTRFQLKQHTEIRCATFNKCEH